MTAAPNPRTALALGCTAIMVVLLADPRAAVRPTAAAPRAVAAAPGDATPPAAEPDRGVEVSESGPLAAPEPTAPVSSPSPSGPVVLGPAYGCAAGSNGGATDRGVSATSIELFATVTRSGGDLSVAQREPLLRQLVAEANTTGFCGRTLDVEIRDDNGANSSSGRAVREGLAREPFAMALLGDPDGLRFSARRGDPAITRTPVVAPSGEPSLYGTGWVWPVGVSDADVARVMVREAHRRGARTFGMVYEDRETGVAFDAEVFRLTGRHVAGYGDEACERHACRAPWGAADPGELYADPPDFVGVLLPGVLARNWMTHPLTPAANDSRVPYGHGALEPALDHLARCGLKCHGLRVWSAFEQRCGGYASGLASAHTAGRVLLDAVRLAGWELTRARARSLLDTTTFAAPLAVAGSLSFATGLRAVRPYDVRDGQACDPGPVERF
jgi:hypothetical protein